MFGVFEGYKFEDYETKIGWGRHVVAAALAQAPHGTPYHRHVVEMRLRTLPVGTFITATRWQPRLRRLPVE